MRREPLSHPVPYHPVVFFVLSLVPNFFLSYGHLSLEASLWFFLVLALLFIAAFMGISQQALKTRKGVATPSNPPLWVWSSIAAVGVSLFIYQLVHLQWLLPDEGNMVSYSVELSRQWTWHFFFSNAQHPPLFNWILALYFKANAPSLLSTWFFPALVGLLVMAIGFQPIRRNLPGLSGLAFFFLLSASFWPIFMAAICNAYVMGFLWEVLTLGFFVRYLKADPRKRLRAALALGCAVGLGFFATLPWLLLAAPLTLAVGFDCLHQSKRRQWKVFSFYFLPLLTLAFLFAGLSVHEKVGEHVKSLFSLQNGYGLGRHLGDWGGYVSALFWGHNDKDPFCPVWGGIFNPVLDSLFFLGIVESWRLRKTPRVQWVFLALASCWVPAFISSGVEMYRVFLAIPFLFFIVGTGFQALALSLAPSIRPWSIGILLASSCLLDFHHLQVHLDPRLGLSTEGAQSYYRAYQVLKRTDEEKGPGAFLLDVGPDMENQNLLISTYPFNAAVNLRLSFRDCRWIAVVVHEQYQPFLSPRFPHAAWYPIGPDRYWQRGMDLLAVIPLEDKDKPVLEKWIEAERLLQPITSAIRCARADESQKPFVDDLEKVYAEVRTDRFLAATLIERMLFYKRVDPTPPTPLELIQRGIQEGYLLPVFLKAEGLFLKIPHKLVHRRAVP